MLIRHIVVEKVPYCEQIRQCIEKHILANNRNPPKVLLYHKDYFTDVSTLRNISSPNGIGYNYQGVLLVRTEDIKRYEIISY